MKRPYIILNKCDNTPGCPIIQVCPKDIFYYDYDVGKILLNENICLEYGFCVTECEHETVSLISPEEKANNKSEEEYGLALAHRLKSHYGIEPSQTINDKKIKDIGKIENIEEKENVICLW